MESIKEYCDMRLSMKAKAILVQSEIKKEDFSNEAVYNTVVDNVRKMLVIISNLEDKITIQDKALNASRLLLIAVKEGDLDVYEGDSATDYLQILEDALNKL